MDVVEVVFEPSRDGSVMTRIGGTIAFVDRRSASRPAAGEWWQVEVVGANPTGRVKFVRPVKRMGTREDFEARQFEDSQKKIAAEKSRVEREIRQWFADNPLSTATPADVDRVVASCLRSILGWKIVPAFDKFKRIAAARSEMPWLTPAEAEFAHDSCVLEFRYLCEIEEHKSLRERGNGVYVAVCAALEAHGVNTKEDGNGVVCGMKYSRKSSSWWDSGEEYEGESEDGYRPAGYFQARQPGTRREVELLVDGISIDVPSRVEHIYALYGLLEKLNNA